MRLRVAHASLQWSLSKAKHAKDAERLFDRANARNYAWIMGTEAGPGAGNQAAELRKQGRAHGYRMFIPNLSKDFPETATECWIGVREDLILKGSWDQGYLHMVDPAPRYYEAHGIPLAGNPLWGAKGLVHVTFDAPKGLGEINLGVGHYFPRRTSKWAKGLPAKVNVDELNEKIAGETADWFRANTKGKAIGFYSGDQNMDDKKLDTFFGSNITSLGDELKVWPNTGFGPIDVIATMDRDKRVSAVSVRAFND